MGSSQISSHYVTSDFLHEIINLFRILLAAKAPSRQPSCREGIFVLEVHAVVDAVRNRCVGIIFDPNADVDVRVMRVISRVISVSRVADGDAAAGHFVKLRRCQLDKFAKVIHS